MKMRIVVLLPILILFMAQNLRAGDTREIKPGEGNDSVKVAILKDTGFFKKNETRISYRASDGEILKIVKNGKELPPSRYSEFADEIVMIREINLIDRMKPEIDRVRTMLKDTTIDREVRVAATDSLFRKLAGFRSSIGKSYIDILESETKIYLDAAWMKYDIFEVKLNSLMAELLNDPDFKAKSVEIRKQQVKVDGKEMPPEINAKLLELYDEMFDRKIGKKERLQIEF